MTHKRIHPLFSGIGCSTALILIMVLGAILYFRGGGPFNPGELTAVAAHHEPIDGFNSHAAFEQQCQRCHEAWQGPTAVRCQTCHETIATQRETKSGLHGHLADTERCQTCHTDHLGRQARITLYDLKQFDHARLTPFSLVHHTATYDDTNLLCEDCHTDGRYTATVLDCAGCHTQAAPDFMAQHTTRFGTDCLQCHDGLDRYSDFVHDDFFVLDGEHTAVVCESCHLNRVFAETPAQCHACHAEPDIHAGVFGLECERCHTAVAWTPAELTRHTFPLDHGLSEQATTCETCHIGSYTQYTCYGCHEHTPTEIETVHRQEEIFEFANCIECHATGQLHEGENHD